MAEPFNETDVVRKTYFKQIAERSVDPTDDAGHVPQLETDGYLSKEWVRFVEQMTTFDIMNGTSTPVAVAISTGGFVTTADADVTQLASFMGFVKSDESANSLLPTFLNGYGENIPTGNSTVSFTANAGTDRYLVVFLRHASGIAQPTTMSWNGTSLTKIREVTIGGDTFSVWGAPIGTSGSSQASSISMAGGGTVGNSIRYINAMVYSTVNQATPFSNDNGGTGSTSASTGVITAGQGRALFVGAVGSDGSPSLTGMTSRVSNSSRVISGDQAGYSGATFSFGGSADTKALGISLNSSLTPSDVELFYTEIVDGFSGLTPGATYYLSNTAGAISTSPGTNSVRIGKAISATALLITH
ncbi:MAG: hypothetical protein C0429_09730 [Sphingopyxis sp.]|nr:hypothetical protein [Sphingopyxis sp.]